MDDSWDKHVMDGIVAVNRNLHKGGMLPAKAMELLGMDSHGQPERKGTISRVPVDENPYGVQALYFSIVG